MILYYFFMEHFLLIYLCEYTTQRKNYEKSQILQLSIQLIFTKT